MADAGGGARRSPVRAPRPARASVSGSVSHGVMDPGAVASVASILGKLPGMERRVVELRFGLSGGHPVSASDVARELRLTAREVAEIERRGIERLRVLVPAERLAELIARF